MANESIKAAFERLWLHTLARIGDAVSTAKGYTDAKVSNLDCKNISCKQSDNGKFLKAVDGVATWCTIINAEDEEGF